MGWLSGYTFRKKCTVVATTAGAQTNYQLKLIVGESSGALGEDVDCESHCEDFPNDIRFTKEDGATKHDYWIESVTGTTPNRLATVIIEVASVPISGSVDFYMYYRKAGDGGESSGANTFVAFTGNPSGLGFTETQALNVGGKGWQGVASDGTNLYLFAKASNNNIIYKFDKAGNQLDVNSSPGLDHMSDGCYHDSKLYVADFDGWYNGQPHSEAKGSVRLYNVTSGLPYANEEHAVGDHWAEAVTYYDGYWWIAFHCCSIIRKYDSSWNFVKEYNIEGHGGIEEGWADGNGYQGIEFFQDSGKTYAGLTVHHTVIGGIEFYYFEYDSGADTFTLIDHFDPPNNAANQGWCCDTPLDVSDVWFADRAGASVANSRIREHAGSFDEVLTGTWDEFTDGIGGSLEIMDTPQKRSSSKAFKYTQDSSSAHGMWRDLFTQQTGEFKIAWDFRIVANNKKHLMLISKDQLTWVGANIATDVVVSRDASHLGVISVYANGYQDVEVLSLDTWYKLEEIVNLTTNKWDFWINDIEKLTNLDYYIGQEVSDVSQIAIGGYLEYPVGYYYVQDVRLSKRASPEPTWGTWGEEEEVAQGSLMLKLLQKKGLNLELL